VIFHTDVQQLTRFSTDLDYHSPSAITGLVFLWQWNIIKEVNQFFQWNLNCHPCIVKILPVTPNYTLSVMCNVFWPWVTLYS